MGSLVLYYQYQAQIDYNYFYFHMLKTTLLICFVLLITHQQSTTLQYKGLWGDFGQVLYPSTQFLFGCGAQLQFQGDQGNGDDTAANGLRIRYCDLTNWNVQQTKQIRGQFGDWKGMQMCPEGTFVMGFQVRYEDSQEGGDDTALNGLKIVCRHPDIAFQVFNSTKLVTVFEGNWGNWKNASQDKANFVRGFSIQYESYQGDGDDTGMNGLTFSLLKMRRIDHFGIKYLPSVNFGSKPLESSVLTSVTKNNCNLNSNSTLTLSTQQGKSYTQSWQTDYAWSIGLTISSQIKIGVDQIVSGSLTREISLGYQKGVTLGQIKTFSVSTNTQYVLPVEPKKSMKGYMKVDSLTDTIPFILTVYFNDDTKRITSGTFNGVITTEAYAEFQDVKC